MDDKGFDTRREKIISLCFLLSFSFWPLYTYSLKVWEITVAPDHTQWLTHTHTHTHTQSVGLLWTSDQSDAETSTWQHTALTIDIHAPTGIPTHNCSKRTAADPRLRPYGHLNRRKDFCVLQNVHSGYWAQPASYSIGIQVLFPGVQAAKALSWPFSPT
jgi:hypothetical protein